MSDTIVPPAKIALLGLGKMGGPMARRLADAGYSVQAWTRSGALPESAGANVVLAASIESAVKDASAVVAVLASPEILDVVMVSAMGALAPGAVVIDMGTSGVASSKRNSELVNAHGGSFLDAPVSGGVGGAEAGTLTIFVGGDQAPLDRAQQILETLGTPHHLGTTGAGQTAKLANQIIVGITIAAVAEGLAFAGQQGLHAAELLAALRGGFADSSVLRTHGPKMAARKFPAGGAIRHHVKDLDLAFQMAGESWTKLDHAQIVRHGFQDLVANGYGDEDHSGYFIRYM